MEQFGYHIWIQQRRVYKQRPFFFTKKKFVPTKVIYEMLFASNLKRLGNKNDSGASANDVYASKLWYFDWLLFNAN
jgi:hypothetical protein